MLWLPGDTDDDFMTYKIEASEHPSCPDEAEVRHQVRQRDAHDGLVENEDEG